MSLTKVSYSMINGAPVNVLDYGASPSASSATNTTAFQAAIDAGFPIYIPSGTYNVGGLTLRDGSYLYGDGMEATKLVYTGTGTFINAERATDAFITTSVILEKLSFDGTTKGSKVGFSLKFRHNYALRDCRFKNFSTLIRLDEPWLGTLENIEGTGCDIGFDLRENVNRVDIESCSITDFAQYAVKLVAGVTGFGKIALVFNNCDFEYGAGVCVYSNTPDLVAFNDCYIGEGCDSSVFEIVAGNMVVNGGLVYYGDVAAGANRLVEFIGTNPLLDERSLLIQNAKVSMAGANGVPQNENLVKGDGQLYISQCNFGSLPFWNGVTQSITGNPLGSLPGMSALLSPFGTALTAGVGGIGSPTATFSTAIDLTTGARRITCTATGLSTDYIYLNGTLQADELASYGAVSVIIVYKSNTSFDFQLEDGSGNRTSADTVPSSSDALKTFISYNQNPLSRIYTIAQCLKNNPQTNDYFEVKEIYVFDQRQAGIGGNLYPLKNLYKPI
jgi:hypothetical protein